MAVFVGPGVKVPSEYVKNNEIVLNISFDATSGMRLGNDAIEFKARFGGVSREIYVPVDHVIAVYARENGQGMAFPAPVATESAGAGKPPTDAPAEQRGLRLATKVPATTEESPSLVPASPSSENPPPDGPGAGGGGGSGGAGGARPALKRIK
jgi:stringent starvation protein B